MSRNEKIALIDLIISYVLLVAFMIYSWVTANHDLWLACGLFGFPIVGLFYYLYWRAYNDANK